VIQKTDNSLNPNPFWNLPINRLEAPPIHWVDLFDQNGYDLTQIEQEYSQVNEPAKSHRYRFALKYPWMEWKKENFSHFNHCLLFERKAYSGEALDQLRAWTSQNPFLWKVIQIRSKWGIDVSIDYVDKEGNVFEVFHYEWDDFSYSIVTEKKEKIESLVLETDWDFAAMKMLEKKEEWSNLDFFSQSKWKSDFFGVGPEQFKMVIWKTENH